MKHRPIIAAMLSALFFAQLIPYSAWASEVCSKSSPTHSAALLELYSSEGCSSCPPADKLLSQLATGSDANLLVPLALHVDYWDYLGWQDRFASSQFTARQRTLSAATHSNTIYTPEFFLNGQEFRGSMSELRDDWSVRSRQVKTAEQHCITMLSHAIGLQPFRSQPTNR